MGGKGKAHRSDPRREEGGTSSGPYHDFYPVPREVKVNGPVICRHKGTSLDPAGGKGKERVSVGNVPWRGEMHASNGTRSKVSASVHGKKEKKENLILCQLAEKEGYRRKTRQKTEVPPGKEDHVLLCEHKGRDPSIKRKNGFVCLHGKEEGSQPFDECRRTKEDENSIVWL